MMEDNDLILLAAKAAGLEAGVIHQRPHRRCPEGWTPWNPLQDDGDALRLAVKIGLVVDCSRPSAGEPFKQHAIWLDETMSNAELARRAIVMAAADIGAAAGAV
jgi:hypothetical protein